MVPCASFKHLDWHLDVVDEKLLAGFGKANRELTLDVDAHLCTCMCGGPVTSAFTMELSIIMKIFHQQGEHSTEFNLF